MNKNKILFGIMLMFVFGIGLISLISLTSAATQPFQGGMNWGFSGVQYNTPGSYRTFSQDYASVYWPILGDRERCEAQSDFLIFVRPGGCSPSVVRSDLLEEQNVPVFCKIDVVKLNPLVDISQLKSVRFSGDFGKYVAGVNFHPNAEAISSGYDSLENPLINDAGYVVVVLKRIQAEKDMPDSVRVNLTGVLRYDAKNFFGAGQQNFYLNVVDAQNWSIGDNYKENSFFKGRGYLKLDDVQEERAYVSVYRDKDTKLTSFVLEKGKTSKVYYMPGFYCKAGISLRLDDLIGQVKKVVLEVDDNQLSLVEGEYFLDNMCRVRSIVIGQPDINKHTKKSVSITCNRQGKVLEYSEDKDGNKIDVKTAEGGQVEYVNGNALLDQLPQDVFNQATTYANDIAAFYGSTEGDQKEIFSAKALYQLGILADKLKQNATAQEIFLRIIADYPNTGYATGAEDKLKTLGAPSASYKEHNIRLIKIDAPDVNDASAEIEINNNLTKGIQEGEYFGGSDNKSFRLIKLYADKVDLEYKPGEASSVTTVVDTTTTTTTTGAGKFTLAYGGISEKRGEFILSVKEIHYVEIAKVSIVSQMSNSYSKSDFLFEIGIEKRAIQLSPAKTQKLIDNLNAQIKSLEGTVNSLGKVVKGMKTACFATSSLLVVKNLFTNMGGAATARQKVMPQYYAQCEREVGTKTADMNACLNKKNAEIEKEIALYAKTIAETNKEVINAQKNNLVDPNNPNSMVNRDKSAKEFLAKEFPNGGVNGLDYTSYRYNETTQKIEEQTKKITYADLNKSSLSDLRDLDFNNKILQLGSDVSKQTASAEMDKIGRRLEQKTEDKELCSADEGGRCKNNAWVNSVQPKFHQRGTAKDKVYLAPIPRDYTQNINGQKKLVSGFYVIMNEEDYTSAGDIKGFWLQNIGSDELKDITGDQRIYVNYANIRQTIRGQLDPWNLTANGFELLLNDAEQVIKASNSASGQKRFNLLGTNVVVDLSGTKEGARCQDFMSPSDCSLMFNVCDPVICPSSRCDLGGRYRVDNVIQSGIIGSIALCLPNIKEPIYMPVCLSGIHAGLDAYLGILKSYRDCLKENLETGKTIGICDEIHSIYLCEFFWRQAAPFLQDLMISMMEKAQGQGMKGGGEYLTVQDAWTNAEKSVNYIQNDYAVNSYNAFKIRSTADIGTEFCKLFVSAKIPNKGLFDNLVEPDSPVQFHAWYDEIPYTDATVPATSQYKVFYYIWAGKDIGCNYQIYLKTPAKSAYVTIQETVIVDTGYANKGGYVSQTRDFTAPAGYQELCVRINGKDECGFKKVSTSFAVDYATSQYYKDQLTNPVETKDECVSGSSSAYALLTTPNIQEGVQGTITPNIDTKGVVRICSTGNPGKQTEQTRWKDVGFCDDESLRCWLDTTSVSNVIKDRNLSAEIIQSGNSATSIVDTSSVLTPESVKSIFDEINNNWLVRIKNEIAKGSLTIPPTKSTIVQALYESSKPSGAPAYGIYILKLIQSLEEVETKGSLNKEKAQAGYYKFEIFEILGNGLTTESVATSGSASDIPSYIPQTETTNTYKLLTNGIITLDGIETGLTIDITNKQIYYKDPLSYLPKKLVGTTGDNILNFQNDFKIFPNLKDVEITELQKTGGYNPESEIINTDTATTGENSAFSLKEDIKDMPLVIYYDNNPTIFSFNESLTERHAQILIWKNSNYVLVGSISYTTLKISFFPLELEEFSDADELIANNLQENYTFNHNTNRFLKL